VAVIENVEEKHLKTAVWLFPLYMLAINVFVLPIAFGGLLRFPRASTPTASCSRCRCRSTGGLALLVFVGGISAATGMVIVETIALSTMVCNDLVMPILLRWKRLNLAARGDFTALLLDIRRGAIVVILLLGYFYFRSRARPTRWSRSGSSRSRRWRSSRPRVSGRPLLEGRTRNGALAGLSPASRCGSTRCSCRPSRSPAGSAWTSSSTASSASSSCGPRSSSASRASTRSPTR
jgi:hypothetical protein